MPHPPGEDRNGQGAPGPVGLPPRPDRPSRDEEGVDLTLVRWMLRLSPGDRLRALQGAADSLSRLRHARPGP